MKKCIALLLLLLPFGLIAQVYQFEKEGKTHRILKDKLYLIETVYDTETAEFVLSRGGFYAQNNTEIEVQFEFNSNYEQDGLKTIAYPSVNSWVQISNPDQALEGKWLMAGRVKPEGEQRRDLNRSRKTMKFLLDGYFQWTAFDTASMSFKGCGGGTYSAKDGAYVETLNYFSRDNSKVGKVLPFAYTQKGDDWYHKGFNSKGGPMHEIWHKRPIK